MHTRWSLPSRPSTRFVQTVSPRASSRSLCAGARARLCACVCAHTSIHPSIHRHCVCAWEMDECLCLRGRARAFVRLCVRFHPSIHGHTCMHASIQTHASIRTHTCVYTRTHPRTHIDALIPSQTHTRIRAHAHLLMHSYDLRRISPRRSGSTTSRCPCAQTHTHTCCS